MSFTQAGNQARSSLVDLAYQEFPTKDDDAQPTVESRDLCSRFRAWCSKNTACIWCMVILVYFFVFIPASLMLIIHGYKRGFALTIGLGVLVLCVSTCVLPAIVCGCRWWRRRNKKRRRPSYRQQTSNKQTDKPDTAIVT